MGRLLATREAAEGTTGARVPPEAAASAVVVLSELQRAALLQAVEEAAEAGAPMAVALVAQQAFARVP